MKQLCLFVVTGLLFTACAQTPKFETHQVDRQLTPSGVVADISSAQGKTAMWGGIIISGKNFKAHTRLEVLAYPVDEDGVPDRQGKPLGRFLAQKQGYLETSEYSEGRYVTVIGPVQALDDGKIGESDYKYPVLTAEQLHLWPTEDSRDTEGQFHFGIGVIFH